MNKKVLQGLFVDQGSVFATLIRMSTIWAIKEGVKKNYFFTNMSKNYLEGFRVLFPAESKQKLRKISPDTFGGSS